MPNLDPEERDQISKPSEAKAIFDQISKDKTLEIGGKLESEHERDISEIRQTAQAETAKNEVIPEVPPLPPRRKSKKGKQDEFILKETEPEKIILTEHDIQKKISEVPQNEKEFVASVLQQKVTEMAEDLLTVKLESGKEIFKESSEVKETELFKAGITTEMEKGKIKDKSASELTGADVNVDFITQASQVHHAEATSIETSKEIEKKDAKDTAEIEILPKKPVEERKPNEIIITNEDSAVLKETLRSEPTTEVDLDPSKKAKQEPFSTVKVVTEEIKVQLLETKSAKGQTIGEFSADLGSDLKPSQDLMKETKVEDAKMEEATEVKKELVEDRENASEVEESRPYQVTTPTSTRRVQSQRMSREERPNLVPVHTSERENYSSDEDEPQYIVEEPKDDDDERARIHSSPDIFGSDSFRKSERKINVVREESQVRGKILEETEHVKDEKVMSSSHKDKTISVSETSHLPIQELENLQTLTREETLSSFKKDLDDVKNKQYVSKEEALKDTSAMKEQVEKETAAMQEFPKTSSNEIASTVNEVTEKEKCFIQDTIQMTEETAKKEEFPMSISKETGVIVQQDPISQSSEQKSNIILQSDQESSGDLKGIDTRTLKTEGSPTIASDISKEAIEISTVLNLEASPSGKSTLTDTGIMVQKQSCKVETPGNETDEKMIVQEKELIGEEFRTAQTKEGKGASVEAKEESKQTISTEKEKSADITDIFKSSLEQSKEISLQNQGQENNELSKEEVEKKSSDVLEPLPNLPQSPEKPRALFHIESDDDIQLDIDLEARQAEDSESSVEEFIEKVKRDIQDTLEREESGRMGIFHDLSDDSLSKTKELVDERLRKISDPKPPEPEVEETPVQIGRFHVVPAPEPIVEKEIPEKLTEADFEEVLRELKMEGLQPGVYLMPEEKEKEEKKEKTLKRVERRFERMASETLEADKREGDDIGESIDNSVCAKRFQRMYISTYILYIIKFKEVF